jgi:hypothetical protein
VHDGAGWSPLARRPPHHRRRRADRPTHAERLAAARAELPALELAVDAARVAYKALESALNDAAEKLVRSREPHILRGVDAGAVVAAQRAHEQTERAVTDAGADLVRAKAARTRVKKRIEEERAAISLIDAQVRKSERRLAAEDARRRVDQRSAMERAVARVKAMVGSVA